MIELKCRVCITELERDLKTGNYFCPKPECGKGGIRSKDGIKTIVDEHGDVTLFSTGKPD